MLRPLITGLAAISMTAAIASLAHAQKMTEQFIPLGKSPGVSGVNSYVGTISKIATGQKAISVTGEAGEKEINITEKTKIWLDRSKYEKSNAKGDVEDLKQGRRVEVKYRDAKLRESAEWIKVAPEE